MKKLLVTGSSGQVGSYIYDLLSDHRDITGIDLAGSHRTAVVADITRMDPSAIGPFDEVVHCAAQVSVPLSVEDPFSDCMVNAAGTVKMLEAARKNDARFVYISSAAVYGEPESIPVPEEHPTRPESPYGLSKLTGERYVLLYRDLYGLKVSVIRPFNIFSPRQAGGVIADFARTLLRGGPISIRGDGEQVRDFIHAGDVASIVRLCLESASPPAVLNACTGTGISINDIADAFMEVFPEAPRPVHVPSAGGDIKVSVGDASRAISMGFRPSDSVIDYIRRRGWET